MNHHISRSAFLVWALLFLASLSISAQNTSQGKADKIYASLEYYDNKNEITITDLKGFEEQALYFGYVLDPGHTIKTGKSSAEIRLEPNGSIIKLAPSSTFTIQALQGLGTMVSNDFTLISGKMRVVASRLGNPAYQFRTPTAVAGVRGTDFGLEVVSGTREKLVVRDGIVTFTTEQGISRDVQGGQAIDARADNFLNRNLSLSELAIFFEDLDFSVLSPLEVPGESEQSLLAEPGTSDGLANQADTASSSKKSEKTWKDYLDITIGTLLVENQSFGLFAVKPEVDNGIISARFNFPIMYQGSPFEPSTWYFPEGNNEWSFGTDQGTDSIKIANDLTKDILLKIEYLKWGGIEDDFYLHFGEIGSYSLGNGTVLNKFSPNNGYPAFRKQGISLGIDTGGSAFQFFTNNTTELEVLAFHYVQRPAPEISDAGLGIYIAADINPVARIPDIQTNPFIHLLKTMDPIITHGGFDLFIPILTSKEASLNAFGDFGLMFPYVRNAASSVDLGTFRAGPYLETVFDPVSLTFRNFGWKLGASGTSNEVDWLLELQGAKGPYRHTYLDAAHEGTSVYKLTSLLSYMANAQSNSAYDRIHMALRGQVSFDLYRTSTLLLSYRLPWSVWAYADSDVNPDEFSVKLQSKKNMIPYGLSFDLEFQRKHFLELFTRFSPYQLIDEFSFLKAGLGLPVGEDFSIKVGISSVVKHKADGTVYITTDGRAVAYPVLSIETVLGE